jgi:hypothetical protein
MDLAGSPRLCGDPVRRRPDGRDAMTSARLVGICQERDRGDPHQGSRAPAPCLLVDVVPEPIRIDPIAFVT